MQLQPSSRMVVFALPLTTTTALHTATLLVEWMNMQDNQEEVDVFSRKLLMQLKSCLPQRTSTLRKPRREAIWRSYCELRTSPSFLSLWVEFLSKAVSVEVHPIKFTDNAFQAVVEESFGQSSTGQYTTVEPVTYEEVHCDTYSWIRLPQAP